MNVEEVYQNAVQSYANSVYRFAYKSSQDKLLAQEVTIDVFLKLKQDLPTWKDALDAKLCLFKMTYVMMSNDIRIKPGLMVHSGLRPDSLECSVVSDEECQDLLFKRLTQTEKYILLLSDVETFSPLEIASIMSLPESQIEDLLSKIRLKSKQIFIGDALSFSLPPLDFPHIEQLLEEKKEVDWMKLGMPAMEWSIAAACVLLLFVPLIRGQMNTDIPESKVAESNETDASKIHKLKSPSASHSKNSNLIVLNDSLLIQDSSAVDSSKLAIENQDLVIEHPKKIRKEKIFKQAIEEIQPLKQADMLLQEPHYVPAEPKQEHPMMKEEPKQKEDNKGLRGLFKRRHKKEEEPVVQADEEY